MSNSKRYFNQRNILILLLALLVISMALNIFLWFELIRLSLKFVTGTAIDKSIQGGMGTLMVLIDNPPFGGLMLPAGGRFNVTISISLWDPSIGSAAYGFSFKLYECTAHNAYPDTPIAERAVTMQKNKDAMYVGTCITFTVTAPAAPGVYIYKVAIGGVYDEEVEFPILTE